MRFYFPLLLLTTGIYARKQAVDFYIKKESQLIVSGDASIISFTCLLKNAFDLTPFRLKGQLKQQMHLLEHGQIKVPTKNLDCGEKKRNQEMLKLLKAHDFPYIVLDFKELGAPEWKKSGKNQFLADIYSKIEITLGGITILYPVHLNLIKVDEQNILASGSKKIKLSDFKIYPSSYLFGMVKIKEIIDINFELILLKKTPNVSNLPLPK